MPCLFAGLCVFALRRCRCRPRFALTP
jgi:hypothetical protein